MTLKKVLIVDDSEPDQFLAKSVINKYNSEIEVMQAYNGEEALKLLDEVGLQPDVIFLDINMPVMNGHEFLEEYSKRDDPVTVVVMLTSSDQEKDRQRSTAYNCVKKYFTKPLDFEDLEDISRLKD